MPTDHCTQERTIEGISVTLQRMEKAQERVVELLTHVANQDVRINHLETTTQRYYEHFDELFERMRKIELTIASGETELMQKYHDIFDLINIKLDRLSRFVGLITSRPAMIMYTALVVLIGSGTIMDFMYHYETFRAIAGFLRG